MDGWEGGSLSNVVVRVTSAAMLLCRGPCVDVHAPGVNILSAVQTSASASQLKTGTSMATPHVAGLVALYLERHPVSTGQPVSRTRQTKPKGTADC